MISTPLFPGQKLHIYYIDTTGVCFFLSCPYPIEFHISRFELSNSSNRRMFIDCNVVS